MLLDFSVKNHLSFAEEQRFSMFAAKAIKKPEEIHLLPVPNSNDKALACALIYGANAAGKSNLLKAFAFIRNAVMLSFTSLPDSGTFVTNFALDPALKAAPSEFSIDFIAAVSGRFRFL